MNPSEKSAIAEARKRCFDEILTGYLDLMVKVISNYQRVHFGIEKNIVMKKELIRHFNVSADTARKILDGSITKTPTMIHALDIMEDILCLYDPAYLFPGRNEQLKRKRYFFKTYVVNIDITRPIGQK